MRARRSWVRWLATTALAAWFAAAFAGATAFAVSPLPSSAPAPPPGRWRDATLDDYRKHLADLIPLVESCGKARDLKNCDPLLVGPDDRMPLAEGANAERRLVRFGWLRVLFSRAEEPDEPATNSGGAQKSGTDQANTQAAQPTTTQLLQAAANRLAYDLAQASRAVPTEAANTQERAIMQEVLAGRDFRGLEQPSARDTVMEKVGAWLNHLIESVTRLRARSAWIGRLLVWGFVLALCVGAGWALLQLERRWRVRLVPEGREAASSAASARNWQLWLEDARQRSGSGQVARGNSLRLLGGDFAAGIAAFVARRSGAHAARIPCAGRARRSAPRRARRTYRQL